MLTHAFPVDVIPEIHAVPLEANKQGDYLTTEQGKQGDNTSASEIRMRENDVTSAPHATAKLTCISSVLPSSS